MASTPLSKLAYQTLQQGKSIAGLAHKELSTKLMELLAPDAVPKTEPVSAEVLGELQLDMRKLQEQDWQDAEQGIYPEQLLFDAPWLDWVSRYPQVWMDLPSTWDRRRERNVRDLPKETEKALYPEYYLQNILEVVLRVERFFGFLGQIPHIALAASIPGGGKIHPNLRVAADPVEPGCIKQQLLGVDPLFGVLPVLFLEFPHIQLQLSKNFGGHGLGFRHRIWRQQLHQLGAQLLVGQARDAFALLKRLVRKLAQGR